MNHDYNVLTGEKRKGQQGRIQWASDNESRTYHDPGFVKPLTADAVHHCKVI